MIKQRLAALRSLMEARGVDACLVPTSDFHGSEYVAPYFKCRKFISGFTGSAGTAIITKKEACLWTDGRYFVQAARELEGTEFILMRMGEPDVPTVEEYLKSHLTAGQSLAFDGRVVSSAMGEKFENDLEGVNLVYDCDLVGDIWENRPALTSKPAWILEEKWTGESASSKLARVRAKMEEAGANVHVLTSLDDIVWMLNLRGDDVPCNPVVLSYLVLTIDGGTLYVMDSALTQEIRSYIAGLGLSIRPYNAIYDDAKEISGQNILLECGHTNYALCRILSGSNTLKDDMNPASLMKAVKNETEMANIRKAHIKDGIAVTKYLYWLKTNIGKIPMDEISVSEKLEEFRREQEGYLGPSFDTISAYGPNAAMCHYSATPESYSVLEPRGLYLVDSGGQYYEGTTDITRTVALGELTDEEKLHFTLTAMGMLRLGNARFLHGCTGVNLDYLARGVYWERGLNFNHGTGHGVGYLLNVHERPNGVRWRLAAAHPEQEVFEEGMLTSDEPGIYIEGSHGIRTENLMLCRKDVQNEYGQFMRFEFVTLAPIDLDAICTEYMEAGDVELLNRYHREVYEKISPYLTEEEREWLKEYTRPLCK